MKMVTLHEGKQFIIDNSRIATAEEAAKLSGLSLSPML